MSEPIKVNVATDDRTPEQALRAAPVSLPAGSFDSEAISKAFEAANKSKDAEARVDAITAAINKNNEIVTDFASADLPDGYKRIQVEVAELGIVENRVVYDAPVQSKTAAAPAAADSKGE
jgi:hypothetical protein